MLDMNGEHTPSDAGRRQEVSSNQTKHPPANTCSPPPHFQPQPPTWSPGVPGCQHRPFMELHLRIPCQAAICRNAALRQLQTNFRRRLFCPPILCCGRPGLGLPRWVLRSQYFLRPISTYTVLCKFLVVDILGAKLASSSTDGRWLSPCNGTSVCWQLSV